MCTRTRLVAMAKNRDSDHITKEVEAHIGYTSGLHRGMGTQTFDIDGPVLHRLDSAESTANCCRKPCLAWR
jgi:hypothetical protein